jgi:hypothetical protein
VHLDNDIDPSLEDLEINALTKKEVEDGEEEEDDIEETKKEGEEVRKIYEEEGKELKEPKPIAMVHFESSKSFVEILKKTPNLPPHLIRGRKSNRERLTYEA